MRAMPNGREKKINHLQMCLCVNFPMLKRSKNQLSSKMWGSIPGSVMEAGFSLPSPQFPEGICHHFPMLKLIGYAQKAAK